ARGVVTTWGYNLKKGVNTSVSYSDSTPGIQYAYNCLNQLTQVTDASGSRTITYTPYNEPDTDSITIGGASCQLQENYDAYGRSSGYTLKQGTDVLQEASQGYEANGRLAGAGIMHEGTEQSFAYGYLAGSSLPSSLAMPNGIVRELAYEEHRDLAVAISCRLGETALVSRSQSYDALGRPVTRTQQRGTEATRTDSFNYNGRNELTGATLGTEPYGYSYDNIGNRKTARELAEELTYAANNLNQYTSIEEKTEAPFVPTYDASGNQTLIKTSTGIWTVVYNAANRAVSFTSQGGSTVVECGYDYQGRRYMKKVTVNGTVASHERYLYRGYLQLAALDMLDNRNVLRTLLWDPLEPVATRPLALVQENALYCYGMDFNKNVTEVFAGEGAIAATYDYSPYGQVVSTGDLVQPVQWSSEMNDVELALVYYNYRYYNPADGRWINRDPITEEGGWNLYGFIENVVINKYDGLGLKKGFTKTGDPCPKCCKGCERSQERPVIKDAGTKGIDVKASVESPMFTSKCEHNGTCNENCCYVVYTWFDCYNKTCYSQTGDTFNRKVQPLRGVGRARSALGVSVQAYKWCSCNKGKWECHNVLLLSNTLLYQVDNPNNPKEWILIIPNKK
uniref:RHS repeat domain-containing protein n=1 Tax=Akkermansia sp. TaxID=1872421 RepID=UPI003FD6F5CB